MVQLPRSLTDSLFRKKVHKGTVIRTCLHFDDGSSKEKRIVCLNKKLGQGIYFAVATSQTHHFQRIRLLKDNGIFIRANKTTVFEKDTVIDLRKIYDFTLDDFLKRFNIRELEILGELEEVIIKDIDMIVRKSKLISNQIKKQIL